MVYDELETREREREKLTHEQKQAYLSQIRQRKERACVHQRSAAMLIIRPPR